MGNDLVCPQQEGVASLVHEEPTTILGVNVRENRLAQNCCRKLPAETVGGKRFVAKLLARNGWWETALDDVNTKGVVSFVHVFVSV